MKLLEELLMGLDPHLARTLGQDELSLQITSVTSDSRAVQPGTLFVAVKGGSQDGHEFIQAALQKGALVIVGQELRSEPSLAPYLKVVDSPSALAVLAANFYNNPSHSLKMIGVTGTSGKTTTTYVLESVLKAAGHRVGVIGTINFRSAQKIYESTHTTPGGVELQQLLAEMKKDGCTAVVMEVSSHALKQRRVDAIAFDGMIFHNLSREHLDFHPDMEDYFASKSMLFKESVVCSREAGKSPVAAINADDEYGARLIAELSSGGMLRVVPYAWDSSITVNASGISGSYRGVRFRSEMIGKFNGFNLLAAITLAQALGIPGGIIAQGIADLKSVPGRMERVKNEKGVHVFVDYAHKPDALEKVLRTLREIPGRGRLITVFGCGGDRDRTKRPVMGQIAVSLSDHVFITSDNPRTESPQAIIEEILVGISGTLREGSHFQAEVDRRQAILQAVGMAHAGDIVLIAGKGHEDYQILGKTKIHFDDREIAAEGLS